MRKTAVAILSLIIAAFVAGCRAPEPPPGNGFDASMNFRDIPGVTAEEIAAIEKLQARGRPFTVSNPHNTESFITVDGAIGGFIPMFCKWLTELFGVPFVPEIHELNEMLSGMLAGNIDFGTNSSTPERRQTYYMTEPIYYRSLKIMRVKGGFSPYEIVRVRPVRYVFLQGATQFDVASEFLAPDSFEAIFANTYDEMYNILSSGGADAILLYNSAEAAFDAYGDIVVEDFLPLSVVPATLSTGIRDFEPVISVITKALKHGAYDYLADLYNEGYREYLKNKFLASLNDEEKAYIKENPVIPIATHYMSYPLTFYNANAGIWEGVTIDALEEIKALTGFDFKILNEPGLQTYEFIGLLESGEAYAIPYLIVSDERRDKFLWSESDMFMFDRFALLSKLSFPNVALNEIPARRVGLPTKTAFTELFHKWFPNAAYVTEFRTTDETLYALERGEVDLVMLTQSRLTALTNFYELSGYKANFIFSQSFEARSAFNKDQPHLRSIFDKALQQIDTERIVEQWLTKTYNIESMRLRQQRQRLIWVIVLLVIAVVLISVMFFNNNKKNKTISRLLERTRQFSEYELMKHVLAVKALNFALWDWDVDIPIDGRKNEKAALLESNFRWSQEFRQMLGFKDENDFPNTLQSWANQVHPDDFDRAMDAISAHLNDKSGETPYDLEYRMKTKDGDYRYFHEVGMTQRDESGKPLRFVGGFEDIHEKKEMAKMLERERKNYVASLESILNSIDALIYVSIPETGELLFVNNGIKKAFGREQDNMIGEKCHKVFRGLDKPCDFCKCPQLNKDPGQIIVWEEYNTFINKNFLYSDSYIDWPDGRKVHLHHAKDITELTERKIAEEKAKAASEAKSIFLANMSHEIRTPMNSIVGFSELAAAENLPPKTKDYLSKISQSAELLLAIIDDILDISKIESGKMELESIPFDLGNVFSYCYSTTFPKALEKGVELNYVKPPLQKKILGDPVKLRQIFLNLLSNAVKFTDCGTIELAGTIEKLDNDGVTLLFEVKDSGIGMNGEQVKRIFEPFSQADNSITRKYGGTGLGLTITRNIIKKMGGELAVESAPGEGSRFYFKLRFDLAHSGAEADSPHEENVLNNIERPVFDGEVLVCEDNEMNQQVICEHLQNVGLKFVVAQNGKEGVEVVKKRMENGEKPFDIIFMDIHMPLMGGILAASGLAELGSMTPIVALTANVMSSDLKLYKDAGMSDALSKPFRTQELWKLLMKYLPLKGVSDTNGSRTADNETDMRKHLRLNFLKSNKNAYRDIADALEAGDVKLAHRLAHTLKSNAGQIGETVLQEAAAVVESLLSGGENRLTDGPARLLESELGSTIERLAAESRAANDSKNIRPLDFGEARELFNKLEPMLEKRNPEIMNLLDSVRAIPGAEELARQIEDFDFREAILTVKELKERLFK